MERTVRYRHICPGRTPPPMRLGHRYPRYLLRGAMPRIRSSVGQFCVMPRTEEELHTPRCPLTFEPHHLTSAIAEGTLSPVRPFDDGTLGVTGRGESGALRSWPGWRASSRDTARKRRPLTPRPLLGTEGTFRYRDDAAGTTLTPVAPGRFLLATALYARPTIHRQRAADGWPSVTPLCCLPRCRRYCRCRRRNPRACRHGRCPRSPRSSRSRSPALRR